MQAEVEEQNKVTQLRGEYEAYLDDIATEILQKELMKKYEEIYEGLSKQLEESFRVSDVKRIAQEFEKLGDYRDSQEKAQQCEQRILQIQKLKEEEKQKQQERDRAQLLWQRRYEGKCQYCGGMFKGVFTKVCSSCGKTKNY